jgi:hypothetical protein
MKKLSVLVEHSSDLHLHLTLLILNMATAMLNSQTNPTQSLEDCIRTALEKGEISMGLKAQISDLNRDATDRERALLQILQDAIQDGCIHVKA